jgi:hypothetical protein
MTVPYAFANASGNIALAKLDANFNTPITIGNTSVLLGNTVTTLNNLTLANVTVTSGNVAFIIPASSGGTGLASPGNSGNVLTSTGTAWISSASSGGNATVADGCIYLNSLTISNSYTIAANLGAMSVGPISFAGGANVSISSGSRYLVF